MGKKKKPRVSLNIMHRLPRLGYLEKYYDVLMDVKIHQRLMNCVVPVSSILQLSPVGQHMVLFCICNILPLRELLLYH
jgi:hypothetical protein